MFPFLLNFPNKQNQKNKEYREQLRFFIIIIKCKYRNLIYVLHFLTLNLSNALSNFSLCTKGFKMWTLSHSSSSFSLFSKDILYLKKSAWTKRMNQNFSFFCKFFFFVNLHFREKHTGSKITKYLQFFARLYYHSLLYQTNKIAM